MNRLSLKSKLTFSNEVGIRSMTFGIIRQRSADGTTRS